MLNAPKFLCKTLKHYRSHHFLKHKSVCRKYWAAVKTLIELQFNRSLSFQIKLSQNFYNWRVCSTPLYNSSKTARINTNLTTKSTPVQVKTQYRCHKQKLLWQKGLTNNTHRCINFKINTRVLWLHLLNYPLRYSTWTWCLHLGKCFMLAAGATKLSEAEPSSCLNEPYVCTYGIFKSKILILDHGRELIGFHITGYSIRPSDASSEEVTNSAISPDISSEASSWAKQWK